MGLRRYGTFTGGIDLPEDKRLTLAAAIQPWEGLTRVIVPLARAGEPPAQAHVGVGAAVGAGQPIASWAAGGGRVCAPLTGRVAAVTSAGVAWGEEFRPTPAVEIQDIQAPCELAEARKNFDWRAADPDALAERLLAHAVPIFTRRPRPILRWLHKARVAGCRKLVLNAMENRPMTTADHRLLDEHGPETLAGLVILGRILNTSDLTLAVDWRRTGDYQELLGFASRFGVQRVALPHKYPTGADAILVKVLTRREVRPGTGTLDVGVGVLNVATCFAVYRAVACGEPPVARVVTVAGEGVEAPGNYWVPFGTPCEDLLGAAGAAGGTHLHGDPMTGMRLAPGAVVGPATDAVLALPARVAPTATQCIRCGWCTDHCPARLNVAALNDDYELKQVAHARRFGVQACVGCGVCTYVCPARLPLAQRVRRLIQAVADLQRDMPLFSER